MEMVKMEKRPMEEPPSATSNQDRVPPPLPLMFTELPVGQFRVLEEQLAEQFSIPVPLEPIVG